MDYFPQSLASGEAFCNRTSEQKILKHNIEESKPTLIVSPRRYGKTSLALQVIKKTKLLYAQFDFLSAVSPQDVEKIILKGVGKLLSRIEKGPRKVLRLATDLFSGLSIHLSSDTIGLTIELNKRSADPATNILNILERVERLAEKYKTKIVLFFDEFQRVYEVSDSHAIESMIRQIAQASKSLSFLFSGSNRHLLSLMFNDRNRPFYKLCNRIILNRMSEENYITYINRVARKTNRHLGPGVINSMTVHTERHPYYMNILCSRVWCHETITASLVDEAWHNYAFEERSQVASELDALSRSQRKLLAAIARSGGTSSPRGKEFQIHSDMPSATIGQSLQHLNQRDYVYLDSEDMYQVLDPIIGYILAD